MAISETGLEWLHPHVASTITSNILYTNGDASDVSFFYAIASEKGLDNKVQVMSSGAQFIKEYGDPNMKKFGQAGHNIINLLQSGANVYVLRVLPDDATYAHGFLNIQTKVNVGEKAVKAIDGTIIYKDDVHLRTCTAYTEMTAVSKESLVNQLNIRRTDLTIDGYNDNLLFCIHPIGRGEAYNNLGFRLNLNNSFDDMYDFRVYTFEVIEYDEYENAATIEGPYYVSLYPDATSFTGDSMFIADVLETYSEVVRCIYNEDIYYKLCTLINPNVHPQVIDVLTGQSRMVAGQPETYYDDETLRYEDVHLAITKYDVNGSVIVNNGYPALNIPSPTDQNVLTTIQIDNMLRESVYNSAEIMLEKMKVVLGEILQKRYASQLDRIIQVGVLLGKDEAGMDAVLYDIVGGKYKTREDNLDAALHNAVRALFTNGVLPSQLIEGEVSQYSRPVYERNEDGYFQEHGTSVLMERDLTLSLCIDDLIDVLEDVIPYITIMERNAGYTTVGASLKSYINNWKSIMNSTESFVYTLTSMQTELLALQEELIYAETLTDAMEKLAAVSSIFSTLSVDLLPNLTVGIRGIDPEFNHYVTNAVRGDELFTNVGAAGRNMENAILVVDKVIDLENSTEELLVYYYIDKDGNKLLDADGNLLVQLGDRFILVDDPRIEGLGAVVGDYVVPGKYVECMNTVPGFLLVVNEIQYNDDGTPVADNLISINDPMIFGKGFEVGDFVKLMTHEVRCDEVYPFDENHKAINKEVDRLALEINSLGLTYLTDQYIIDQLDGYEDLDTGEEHEGLIAQMLELINKSLNLVTPLSALYAFSKHYSIVGKFALLSAFGAGCRTTIVKGVYKCRKAYIENYHSPETATNGTMSQVLDNANDAIAEATAALDNLRTYVLTNRLEGEGTIFRLNKGSDGCISYNNSLLSASVRQANIDSLLVQGYKGLIDDNILNRRLMPFKYLLDANFNVSVKNAIVDLAQNIRKDVFAWLDTEICANPSQAIAWRANKFPITTNMAAIYAQDGIVFDEFQGRDVRVTMSYQLAKMIPTHAITTGLQYPMAGNARGGVSLPQISYIPNELQKEEMYNRQVNYVETNGKFNKFGTQLTTTTKNDALVNINNMLVVLDIKRNVEVMAEDVLFEFNEAETINSFQQSLNNFLAKYKNNKSCESISARVYSSDYDKLQKILRVAISVSFYGIIERVIININVVK